MNNKRLYRSRDDQMLAGVCGGIGDYLGIDSTLIRLAFLFFMPWGGSSLLAYLIAWVIIPEAPRDVSDVMPAEPADNVVEEVVAEVAEVVDNA